VTRLARRRGQPVALIAPSFGACTGLRVPPRRVARGRRGAQLDEEGSPRRVAPTRVFWGGGAPTRTTRRDVRAQRRTRFERANTRPVQMRRARWRREATGLWADAAGTSRRRTYVTLTSGNWRLTVGRAIEDGSRVKRVGGWARSYDAIATARTASRAGRRNVAQPRTKRPFPRRIAAEGKRLVLVLFIRSTFIFPIRSSPTRRASSTRGEKGEAEIIIGETPP